MICEEIFVKAFVEATIPKQSVYENVGFSVTNVNEWFEEDLNKKP